MRSRPRGRAWTLATLDPGQAYRLYFDPDLFRWEVAPLEGGPPLRTRTARPAAGAAQRVPRSDGTDGDAAPARTDPGAPEPS